jgi:hypothetical protein
MSKPKYEQYNDVIDRIDIVGGKRWRKLLVLRDKKTGRRYLRLYGFGQNYKIFDLSSLASVIGVLKVGAEALGWNVIGDPALREKIEQIDALKQDKEKYKQRVNELFNELLVVKSERLKESIPKYEQELEEFKTLVNSNPSEEAVQKWLKEHLWVLGAEYLDSQPIDNVSQFTFESSRFDFFLERFDTFFDIIELKKPDARLFTGSVDTEDVSRGRPISKDFASAISQMIHYLELATHKRKELREIAKIDIYKPRGLVVIGRTRNKEALKRLRSVISYVVNIDVVSYDMLFSKAELFIRHLKNRTA